MKIAKNVSKLGTESVYDIFAKTKKLQAEGKKIIDLSLGQSTENTPEHVIEATIKALKKQNSPKQISTIRNKKISEIIEKRA